MNARWRWFCLALAALAFAGCGSNNSSNVTLTISPTSATVLLGTSIQFIPNEAGSSNAITWSVNGIVNGNATVGTISSTGLYTAPATRPVQASPVPVPIIFAAANSSVPGSGITGSVIELQSGFDFTNYASGNTINISGNSVAGWNGSFIIEAAGVLQNGKFGVQIATPAGPPGNGTGGTATATPNITITAQVQSTNTAASATITLDSGIRVAFSQPSCSIGTNETFSFAPFVTVSGAPVGSQSVTWSLTGVGSIDANSGLYTAPSTTGTATITATSLFDPTETASATITIVTAADPTLASVTPPTGALGAASMNAYLTGTNFICTTGVIVNNGVADIPLSFSSGSIFSLSSTSLLVVLPSSILSSVLPASGGTVPLTFKVEREGGSPQSCSGCVVILSPVRPGVVSAVPDSIQQPASSSTAFNVTLDGGYFGTTSATLDAQGHPVQGNPVVNVAFNGQAIGTPTFSNSDRQLSLALTGANVSSGPGLYPITVTNKSNASMAAINLAVQPSLTSAPTLTSLAVGTSPVSIAINTATGVAVVANQGSNNISLVNLATQAVITSICTDGGLGLCTTTGPVYVAVDNIRNLALVANNMATPPSLAVVDLGGQKVTALLNFPSADSNGNAFSLAPVAVGVNPETGRALVAFTSGTGGSNAGAILDLTQSPPALIGVVNINNGPKPRIAVSARLNWALATPGGAGLLSVVDLNRQTTNPITGITCSSGVATVTSSVSIALQAGQPVHISGATAADNGIFNVRNIASNNSFTYSLASCAPSGGGTATYAQPVATIATPPNVRGVSINEETQKGLLVDFNGNVPGFVFDILDQTSASVNALSPATSNIATAINPLTNVGVIVNNVSDQGFLIDLTDPAKPAVISSATFNTGSGSSPVDVAIDPATNTAIIANQGSSTVSFVPLGGPLRSGSPQIIQSSFSPVSAPSQTSSQVTINSALASGATTSDQNVTMIGSFTTTAVPRLDGDTTVITKTGLFPAGCGSAPNICRVMTATIPGTTLASNGPRYYAIDAQDSGPTFSNAAHLQVIQAVNLVSGCANPAPQGAAIDIVHNVVLVTEPGTTTQPCNNVAMVNLATGTGFGASPELAVGSNSNASPQGVAVYPQAGLAVVANAGNSNVSIVDIVNDKIPATFSTDPVPSGVAVDLGTGKAVVTANGASVVDVFPVSTTSQTPTTIGVQRGPSGVAIDQVNHVAVVANSASNNASILSLSSSTNTNTSGSISFPQGVAFDPISDNFLITSSANNQVVAFNPKSVSSTAIRVGIDPSSIAYNFESGTMITANSLSQTMTVVDFINQTVRGVFSLRSSTQFAVDIHPQTNLAVVADTVDNQLLLVPLPY